MVPSENKSFPWASDLDIPGSIPVLFVDGLTEGFLQSATSFEFSTAPAEAKTAHYSEIKFQHRVRWAIQDL